MAGEDGVEVRAIAGVLADRLGVPTASVDPADADAHFGWLARFLGRDVATASSARTRELIGWTPTGPTLLEEIAAGAYDLPS